MRASVTGDKALISKLQSLRKTKAKAAIRKGSRAGCKVVQAAAKAAAPVRTGKLAQAVKVRALGRSRKWTGTQVTTAVAAGGVFYGAFVELGTKKMKPRHFIRNAFATVKGAAGSAFTEGIADEITKGGK